MLVYLIAGTVCAAVLILHWCSKDKGRERGLQGCKRILLVTAHPDDESMFFAPAVISLRDQGLDLYLLCFSSGNYRRQGSVRKKELRNACQVLGIVDSNLTVIEHSKLPDDPYLLWNKTILNEIILSHVEQRGIDTVVSFDEWGVSGHRNHAAIANSLRNLYTHGRFPVNTQVFTLESVNLLRKYAGLGDLLLSSSFLYVSGWRNYFRACRAMAAHRSQFVWFRVLYIIFSRYMFINTFKRIAPEKIVARPYSSQKRRKSAPKSKTVD